LAHDPIDPWPVLLFRWAQRALIVALHRLLHEVRARAVARSAARR
jgi:hypothetical protein